MTPKITLALIALIVLGRFVHGAFWRDHFSRISRVQQIRERFAADRRAAIQLLSNEQLAPDSISFRLLYLISSMLVRRSQSYRHFANRLIASMGESEFRSDSPMIGKLREEMNSWTPDVREVWDRFSSNLDFMVRQSVWQIRVLLWLEDQFGISRWVRPVLEMSERLVDRWNHNRRLPTGIDVIRTGRRTRRWARAAA